MVRFAQSLGFAGYPELQKAARDEYRLGATARPVVHDDQLGFSIEEDVLTRSLKTDALSLEETISKNTLERFNRAVPHLWPTPGRCWWWAARGGRGRRARVLRLRTARHPLPGRHRRHRVERGPAQPPGPGRRAARHRLPQGPFGHHLVRREGGGAGRDGRSSSPTTRCPSWPDKGDLTLYADIDSTFFAHSLVGPISLVSALAAAIYSRDRDLYDARVRAVRDKAAESGWLR